MNVPPLIFDRAARRVRRDRHALSGLTELDDHIAGGLLDRLASVRRRFQTALVINTGHGAVGRALRAQGIDVAEIDHGRVFADRTGAMLCDEDRLETQSRRYDLIIVPGALDSVDDLPGALIAARRALAPGGLYLAGVFGAPGLTTLRHAFAGAVGAMHAVSRLHPQIEVRAAGDLLTRAGFEGAVADVETTRLRYASLDAVLRDLRAAGATNAMASRHFLRRDALAAARTRFSEMADADGRTVETASLITLTGWAASPRSE